MKTLTLALHSRARDSCASLMSCARVGRGSLRPYLVVRDQGLLQTGEPGLPQRLHQIATIPGQHGISSPLQPCELGWRFRRFLPRQESRPTLRAGLKDQLLGLAIERVQFRQCRYRHRLYRLGLLLAQAGQVLVVGAAVARSTARRNIVRAGVQDRSPPRS
jgi:hypothetical protein